MAKIFLDANSFIDAVHRTPELDILESLEGHTVYISPLSVHIYCYIFKIPIPSTQVIAQVERFQQVDFSSEVLRRALGGPTADFEDNVQLHSAAAVECELFVTSDSSLLRMNYFGKTHILSPETLKEV